MQLWKKARFASSSQRFRIGESSAVAAARQPESALAREKKATYARQAWTHAMECIRGLQAEIKKMAPKKSNMSEAAINRLIAQRVADALTEHEVNQNSGNGNGNGSHDSGSGGGRTPHTARETIGQDAAYGMPWKTLMKMMTENYYPRSEIKKPETELWNLVVKGTDVESYTQRFQELILLCSRMVPEEFDRVEKYNGGLLDSIQRSVMASKPIKLQEAIELARSLMDHKLLTYAARQVENKRRLDNNSRYNHAQQSPNKRKNLARAYTAGSGEKREYAGTLPLCNKCKFHHNGAQTVKELAIWPEIVGVPLLLTLKEPRERFRRRVCVLNVGVKGTTRMIAQN
ncbi:reverse transcriptase domain-containing protein [Tanacetum coccineum]